MNNYPVIIAAITLTRPTQKATGYKENELEKLLKDKKYQGKFNNLTVKVEFTQKREAGSGPAPAAGRRKAVYSVGVALKGHDKVSSGDRVKHVWINAMSIAVMQEEGFTVGADLGALKGCIAYLLTEDYLEAEFRDGKIISSPKRKGKNGNILLTKDGEFIFQATELVMTTQSEFETFTYADFVNKEEDARIAYTGEISVEDVPDETREDGFFNDEFEAWLTEEYAERNAKMLVSVN